MNNKNNAASADNDISNESAMNDGEIVLRESKKSTSGQDTVIKPRTDVYRFGKLHSSQG